MGDPSDFVAAQAVVQGAQEDEFAQLAGAHAMQHAPDDISTSYVSKEMSQAMSYSVTADEMKSNAARVQISTITPAPVGAQDAHILQASKGSQNSTVDDEGHDEGTTSRPGRVWMEATGAASSSVASQRARDEPDPDKFEFPIETVAAVLPPPILKAPRKPFLQALTLPTEQSPQPSPHGSEQEDSRRASPTMTPSSFVAHTVMNKKPPRALTRLKTRLQDPPPMTPAVSALVSRGRLFGNSPDQEYPPPMTSRGMPTSRKFSVAGNLSHVASFAAATPGKLRSMASALFTPRGSAATPHPFPPPEEEIDPLDDESIPKYKKWKKTGNRRLHILQWSCLVTACVLLACSVRIPSMKGIHWYNIILWQWLTLALVVTCGRLVAGWAVQLLVFLIERHFLLKRRVLYFVYGLRHSFKNCIWLALVIGTWKVILRNNTDQNTVPVITKILWCFFTASVLWMAKILFVKTAANSFHRAAYFDRIQDCLFHQYVLETISQPKSFEDDYYWGYGTGPAVETSVKREPVNQEPDSAVGRTYYRTNSSEASKANKILKASELETQEHTININGSHAPVVQRGLDPIPPSPAPIPAMQFSSTAQTSSHPGPTSNNDGHFGTGFSPAAGLQTSRARASYLGFPAVIDGKTVEPAVIIAQDKLQGLTSDSVSPWTLKKLMKLVRTHNMSTFSSMLSADWEIDSEAQAKSAAKQIFYNMADPGAKYLTLDNFTEFLPEDKAAKAFGLFEVTDQGHISKKGLMQWVVSVYKERKALSLTLSDNRTVVAKLHRVLDVLMLAILLTICFLIMGVNTQKLLVAFSSILLPSVFVFGNAARSTFESLIFLFIMHPFDVGDRINVDNVSLVVEEMNILNTIFLSGSNEKVYYPNSVLASKPISNLYRSPDQWDAIEFQIHSSTPCEKIGILKERMTKYIESLPQYWYPTFRLVCKDIEDSNRMKMALWMQHHMNFQESGERWQRRSNMILHMKTCMEDLKIGFMLPRQEITVTGIPLLDVPHTRL
ncbi:mechanosensitive ion channel protein 10 isoform X1 [Physcomitrium patens]|uniref:Mechanosensitive ion channel protein n=1 Tax=Physcomitrium patens TaxID=3218 RepID=A0A2K1IAQ2_PHYPA|nr:mechanosensitive ion channel protein 10-like [Physcomitrium patens]PNR26355.1 hypothetical protein PHYPA_030930 [Physcomitrium patens]|eukprot:XP_024367346.1 mechanosensitive ion channel protein 10-like [Physcomitrella patens]